MRTVVGSRGCLAVDLLFRVAGLGKRVAQCLRSDDRRRGNILIPVTGGSPCDRRARDFDVPGGKRPPAIHSRTRRMMSCSISTTWGRRRGAAQSVGGHDKTMNHPEHARTGTSAVGRWTQSATSLPRGDGESPTPAPLEFVIVDLIAQHNEQAHEELAGDGDFGFGAPAAMHERAVGALEVSIHAGSMGG